MVLLDTETPGTSREIYSDDADGEAGTRNQMDCKIRALAIKLYSSKALLGKNRVFPVGVLHHYMFIISEL